MEKYKVPFGRPEQGQEGFPVEVSLGEGEQGNGTGFRSSGIPNPGPATGFVPASAGDEIDRTSVMQCLLEGLGFQSKNAEVSGRVVPMGMR